MQQKRETYTSLRKGLDILKAFIPDNVEMGTTEIAVRLGLNKSTVSRLLSVLREKGFLQQNPENRKFFLGPASAGLGVAIEKSLDNQLVKIARPIVNNTRDQLGENVIFSLAGHLGVVLAYIAFGLGPLVLRGFVGATHEYHCTAGGKAILAFSDPQTLAKILARGLMKRTPNTITDPEELKKELEKIRRQGFAFDHQENNPEIQAFGLPVCEPNGKPVAALVVPGAAQLVTLKRKDQILPAMRKAVMKIETTLAGMV